MEKRRNFKAVFIFVCLVLFLMFVFYWQRFQMAPIGKAMEVLAGQPVLLQDAVEGPPLGEITLTGRNLGSGTGYLVLSGRRIEGEEILFWSDDSISFMLPEDSVSGPLYAVKKLKPEEKESQSKSNKVGSLFKFPHTITSKA